MFKNLIGGEWVEGPRASRNINPSDTRDVLGLCIAVGAMEPPVTGTRPVYRM